MHSGNLLPVSHLTQISFWKSLSEVDPSIYSKEEWSIHLSESLFFLENSIFQIQTFPLGNLAL